MSMLNVFQVAGSALHAQSLRLNTTASNMAKRSRSSPTERRRGLGPPESTKAWISTSIGRVPSSVTSTQLPGTGWLC